MSFVYLPLPHPISSNIEDRSYRTLTPCGDDPIALRRCLRCVLAPIRALSRFHLFYTSNRTRKVTNWHEFVEISSNTARRRMHRLQPPRWSSRSACGRPVHSINCPGRLTVRRLAQPALKHRTVALRARSHRHSRTAGSAAAPRSSPAAAAGFSPPVPLHGTIARRQSQRSHASRKCMAQLSLGSRR